jgi:hypothetical protein
MSDKVAENLSKFILIKRGHLNRDGTPTIEGSIRGNMTPGERAIDRAVKRSGGLPQYYKYDEETNRAHKIIGKGWKRNVKK